tara:strand:+ start:5217 stop:5570 length:354 start_codon:yes stop_codon:yes gene_type:complete
MTNMAEYTLLKSKNPEMFEKCMAWIKTETDAVFLECGSEFVEKYNEEPFTCIYFPEEGTKDKFFLELTFEQLLESTVPIIFDEKEIFDAFDVVDKLQKTDDPELKFLLESIRKPAQE